MNIKLRKRIITTSLVLFFIIVVGCFILPFVWLFVSSFKPPNQIFANVVRLIPRNPTLQNYLELFTDTIYLRWYLNSLIFAAGYILGGLFLSSMAGFAFAKYNFRFQNPLFMVVLSAYALPIHIILVPLFRLLTSINLINTFFGLILPMIVNPLGVFFMRQYMVSGISDELLDAARIDGASEFQIYYRLVIPLSKPALGALAIVYSLFAWNNLLWPLVVMRNSSKFTLTVGLNRFIGTYNMNYGLLMAGSALAIVPVVLLFWRMQDYFIAGLTAGSVKG